MANAFRIAGASKPRAMQPRTLRRLALVTGFFLLALALACGPGAVSEPVPESASQSEAPAASTDAETTAAGSQATAQDLAEGAPDESASAAAAETRAAANAAPSEDAGSEAENGAGQAPDFSAVSNEEPPATVESEPAPTATPSVSQLAAVVEANPPAFTPTPQAEPTAAPERQIAEGPMAAEPVGIYAWINTEPLTLEQLRGKVVLVDFWTYTCVNCVRTFPYLKLWHSRYADDGLVILGIHTPEFEFEKNYWNVLEATEENGIAWPVAQDNDFETWKAYENRFWPAKYLIDQDGIIRYTHFGEGKYAETEEEIRKLLAEAGADLSDDMELPQDQVLDPAYLNALQAEVTPELYAGYERNVNSIYSGFRPYVIQLEFYENVGQVANFQAPSELDPHHIFYHGSWEVGLENTRHARTTNNYEDYLALNYSAKSVNAVLTSFTEEPYRVRVTLDGEYLTEENKGLDVQIGDDGESYIMVNKPRLYEIVNSPQYSQRKELRLSSNSPDFEIFAFTFGVYLGEGP